MNMLLAPSHDGDFVFYRVPTTYAMFLLESVGKEINKYVLHNELTSKNQTEKHVLIYFMNTSRIIGRGSIK